MKNIKIIGGLLLFYFLFILGLLLRTWIKLGDDTGLTDFGGLLMLMILFLTVYYFVLIVWTWRLTMRYIEFDKSVTIQFALIFLFGVLTSLIWLSRQLFSISSIE